MSYGQAKLPKSYGEPFLVEPANPAAGLGLSYAIPAGFLMEIKAVRLTFQSAAAVASRQIEINYYTAGAVMFLRSRCNFLQAANNTFNYNTWVGGPPIAAFIAGTTDYYFSIASATLAPAMEVRIEILSIQAADQLSAVKLFFMRFRDN
jgi:hypothetical protein